MDWWGKIREFIGHLHLERGLAQNTLDAYRRDMETFCAFLVRRRLKRPSRITPDIIHTHMEELSERGLALSTVARHFATIRTFLGYLYMIGETHENIVGRMDSPRFGRTLPKVLSRDQVEKLLSGPVKMPSPSKRRRSEFIVVRDTAILEMLYSTAARCSEMCMLTQRDVDLDHGLVRLWGKGARERMVPLGAFAVVAIKRWLPLREQRLRGGRFCASLFVTRRGQPLDRSAVWRIVQRYRSATGILTGIGPHTLRHSCATHMLENGCNLRTLQEILGHESLVTTQLYTHLDIRQLKRIHQTCHPRQ